MSDLKDKIEYDRICAMLSYVALVAGIICGLYLYIILNPMNSTAAMAVLLGMAVMSFSLFVVLRVLSKLIKTVKELQEGMEESETPSKKKAQKKEEDPEDPYAWGWKCEKCGRINYPFAKNCFCGAEKNKDK